MSENKLFYRETGNKNLPALIFLHGFLGSSEDWITVAEAMSDNFRCILIDLPGHGKSLINETFYYSIKETAELIIGLTEQIGSKKFRLAGYSMGGRLALYLAVHFPEKIEKLLLESASPGLKTEEEKRIRIKNDDILAENILNNYGERFLNEWYDMPFFKSMKTYPDFKELLGRRLQNKPEYIAKSLIYIGTGRQDSLWDEWKKILPETMLLAGNNDEKYKNIALEMKNLNQNADLRIIPDTGHSIHFERCDLFINYANEFFLRK